MRLGIPVIARDLDVFRENLENIDYKYIYAKREYVEIFWFNPKAKVLIDESISLVDDSAFSAKLRKVLLD